MPLSIPRPAQPEGKIFVGGLNWITTTESLKAHFERFGVIADCVIMKVIEGDLCMPLVPSSTLDALAFSTSVSAESHFSLLLFHRIATPSSLEALVLSPLWTPTLRTRWHLKSRCQQFLNYITRIVRSPALADASLGYVGRLHPTDFSACLARSWWMGEMWR